MVATHQLKKILQHKNIFADRKLIFSYGFVKVWNEMNGMLSKITLKTAELQY